MKHRIIFVVLSIICASTALEMVAETQTTRKERNFILDANKAFNDKDYDNAIKLYNEALKENPMSERAKYNLAVTMLKKADEKGGAGGNDSAAPDSVSVKIMDAADSIFVELYENSADNLTKELSIYNSGNINFSKNQYALSIDQYKKALRLNPNNNNARHNLRLAQLKLQQQQNGGGGGQDDQEQEEQEKQQQQEQQQPQQPQPQQQPPQPQKQTNAETILNAAQQNEDKTRDRLEKQQQQQVGRYHEKPW